MGSSTTSSQWLSTNPTAIQLTNAWSVNAGYEHIWNSRWRTSLYGGYTRVWYNQTATDIAAEHLPTPTPRLHSRACGQPVEGAVWPPVALNHGEGNSCSPNFSFWQIGSRTQWDISKDLYMGVDVVYTRLNTAYKGVSPAVTLCLFTRPPPHSTIRAPFPASSASNIISPPAMRGQALSSGVELRETLAAIN